MSLDTALRYFSGSERRAGVLRAVQVGCDAAIVSALDGGSLRLQRRAGRESTRAAIEALGFEARDAVMVAAAACSLVSVLVGRCRALQATDGAGDD